MLASKREHTDLAQAIVEAGKLDHPFVILQPFVQVAGLTLRKITMKANNVLPKPSGFLLLRLKVHCHVSVYRCVSLVWLQVP